jgi:hypothetical protein
MRKLLALFLTVVLLGACSGTAKPGFTPDDVDFKLAGKTLTPGMDYTNPTVKDWSKFEEMDSCLYIGKDRIYTYDGAVVYTYPDDGNDYILEIELTGSSKTGRGIGIGSTMDDVVAQYGETYEEKGLTVVYTVDLYQLILTMVNDKVEMIRLKYITE